MKPKHTIRRGGTSTERLYLKDLQFTFKGTKVVVKKSNLSKTARGRNAIELRHRGRYGIIGLFAKPNDTILDFPCGSGYASEILKHFGLVYQGLDSDPITVAYAKKVYGAKNVSFAIGDLSSPNLRSKTYDIVTCIEGIEHIEQKFQQPLIRALAHATKKGGVLIISSPENPTGISGPSKHNRDHLWELTKKDFLTMLYTVFKKENVDVAHQRSVLSTGVTTTCIYAICHKS